MKKIVLLFVALLMMAACGTENSSEDQISEGNQGTGEPVEEEDEMNDEQPSNEQLQSMIEQLEFTADVTMDENRALFKMNLENKGDKSLELSFSSGQQYEIIITDPDTDDMVYKFSEGMMFTEAIENRTVEPNQSLSWEQEWDYKQNGERVKAKEYNVQLELIPMSINQKHLNNKPFVIQTTVTVPNLNEESN